MVADIEELEKMDASEIYPRRINEVLTPENGKTLIFPIADGTVQGETDGSSSTLL